MLRFLHIEPLARNHRCSDFGKGYAAVLASLPSGNSGRLSRRPEAATIKKLQSHHNELTDAYRLERSNARAHLEPNARFHRQIAAMAGSRRLGAILDNLFRWSRPQARRPLKQSHTIPIGLPVSFASDRIIARTHPEKGITDDHG
ncbi:MAG: FCD domain-containing protein [Agrobacterium tumefaciens]|nr:FCD domain-containing protein [Agrobacterium tumefaciens]